jgi:hypothetical protein
LHNGGASYLGITCVSGTLTVRAITGNATMQVVKLASSPDGVDLIE